MTDPSQPQGLTEVKQYRFVRQLGKGGMGTVFEAIDTRDGGRVAVKLLHPWLVAEDTMFRDRFEREAHIAALLRSPYSVRLLDFGVANDTYFLVMEYVEGATVGKVLEQGPMEPLRAIRIAIDVARALEEAAARGVVHRDIKPDNILLTADGRVKVTDFGIARQEGGTGLTSAGRFVGTAEYAAPEQAGGEADHRTDIYALGATLYCMLAGHPPFQSSNVWELLKLHQSARVAMEPLAGLPDSICNPIRRCLEKDPRDRYQSASELAGALERAMAGYLHDSEAGRAPATRGGTPTAAPAAPAVPRPSEAEPGATRVAADAGVTRVASAPGGPPPTRVAPASPSPAKPAGVTLAIEPAGRGPGQSAAFVAVLTNGTATPLRASLSAADPSKTLAITLPPAVDAAAGQAVRVPFQVRRIRKTPGATAPFQVFATDAAGARLAFANATADFAAPAPATASPRAARAGGRRAPLWIGGGLLVAGGAAAAVMLAGGGGSDTGEPDTTPQATATAALTLAPSTSATATGPAAPTTAAASIQVLDAWQYSFRVSANDCGFGTPAGQQYPLVLRFKPVAGSGSVIKDGDRVNVYAVLDSEVFITAATFRFAGFEFTYNVIGAAGQQGQATIKTTFADATTIASATLTERYTAPACTITGAHSR